MKKHTGLSATAAIVFVLVHVVLAILGAVAIWQWLGGIVVGTLLVVGVVLYGVRGRLTKSDKESK